MFKRIQLSGITIKSLLLLLVLQFTACAELQKWAAEQAIGQLTTPEIAKALRQALEFGIGNGSDALSQKGGYMNSVYKILLPAEVRKVTDKLKVVPGFTNVENVLLEKINNGAEAAAVKAKPIFRKAIQEMTFEDAYGILMGSDNAATSYLQNKTSNDLYKAFQPEVVSSLNQFNALSYWSDAVNAYNKIPFVEKLNPRLDDYVTQEALKGLFSMVEKEEYGIRRDKTKRVTDLLKKAFAQQDSNRK